MPDKEKRNEEHIDRLSDQFHELDKKLTRLSVILEEGFKGVHTRQDTTNGRINKNENSIERLRSVDTQLKNDVEKLMNSKKKREKGRSKMSDRWLNILFQVIAAAIMVLIGLILINGRYIYDNFF